jgi:hypothetical protein
MTHRVKMRDLRGAQTNAQTPAQLIFVLTGSHLPLACKARILLPGKARQRRRLPIGSERVPGYAI